jgi:hypothetical protein
MRPSDMSRLLEQHGSHYPRRTLQRPTPWRGAGAKPGDADLRGAKLWDAELSGVRGADASTTHF